MKFTVIEGDKTFILTITEWSVHKGEPYIEQAFIDVVDKDGKLLKHIPGEDCDSFIYAYEEAIYKDLNKHVKQGEEV